MSRKIISLADKRRAMAAAAMPDVKRLVKKYGRVAVANCLAKIAAVEREQKTLVQLKQKVKSLESRIRS